MVRKPPLIVSQEMRDEHETSGHVTHRSWCAHCVAARASISPHLKAPPDPEDGVPRICIDYYFMGDEGDSMCMLACKDTISKMVESSVVESNGVDKFAKKLLVDFSLCSETRRSSLSPTTRMRFVR